MAKLMLIDGNSLPYRAFFALPPALATAPRPVPTPGPRITSHPPPSAFAGTLTRQLVAEGLAFTARTMREAGFANPRIGVAGLNPHAGDGGNFGREEIDIIAPAVADAGAAGIAVDGPVPSAPVFVRARAGAFGKPSASAASRRSRTRTARSVRPVTARLVATRGSATR